MTDEAPQTIWLELGDSPASRLDKALAAVVPEELAISRSRLVSLIKDGHLVAEDGAPCVDPRAKAAPFARFGLTVPEAEDLAVEAEDIPIDVVFEDAHLIVVNKPSGMVVHPAPGSYSGTLVNALLHHCGDTLSGIGGMKRPGIVHRIDKDTSGLLVVAKSDAAHHGLSKQFQDHSMARVYQAIVWGVPSASDARINGLGAVKFEAGGILKVTAAVARHPSDRKKMAVVKSGGRHAVTRVTMEESFGAIASLVSCRLETGRTHQIRVHMTHVGHPLVGDPVYGRARHVPASLSEEEKTLIEGFSRQALHAQTLGFVHPVSGEELSFSAPVPSDMTTLIGAFRAASKG